MWWRLPPRGPACGRFRSCTLVGRRPQRLRAGGGVQSDGRCDRRVVRMERQHQCDPCGHSSRGGPFDPPVNVSAASQDATRPQLAIASSVTVAVWEQQEQHQALGAGRRFPRSQRCLAAAGQPLCARPEQHRGAGGGRFRGRCRRGVGAHKQSRHHRGCSCHPRPAASGRGHRTTSHSPSHPAVPDVLEFSKTSAAQATAVGLVPRFVGATTAPISYVITETPAPGTIVAPEDPRYAASGLVPGSVYSGLPVAMEQHAKPPGQARVAVAARRP